MKCKRLNRYEIPTQAHEVRLSEVFKYLLDVDPLKPVKWEQLEKEPEEKERLNILHSFSDNFINKQLRPYFETNLVFWSGLDLATVKTFDLAALTEYYYLTQIALTPIQYEYKPVLQIAGEYWTLPGENMENAILFQYAEADQLEANAEKNNQNKFYIFPDIMALLLRKENEPLYLDHETIKQRATFFKDRANMLQAWRVFLYFHETKKLIEAKYGNTLFSKPSREEKKAGAQSLQDAFGWLLTIKRLAEKKVFDIHGFNSQDSVLRTNLWECLTHLAADNALNAYQGRLYDIKTK